MQLFIEPVDVWLFRDGRPFDAHSDHRADSLFPPSPTVMQGVIRSHHLLVNHVDFRETAAIREAVGTADDLKGLTIRGPILAAYDKNRRSLTHYFRVPAAAAPLADGRYQMLQRTQAPTGVITSLNGRLPMLLWPHPQEPSKHDHGAWLKKADLNECLAGRPVTAVQSNTLFAYERRYGIGLDSTRRVTRDEALYEVGFVRPHTNVGLWLDVTGNESWPRAGVLRMGGEGRGGQFCQVNDLPWPAAPHPLPRRFLVYFATPTCFTRGWQPEAWNRFFDEEVQLQAVALSRYEVAGGFDWAIGQQKPGRRLVPAGSVYFFQSSGAANLRDGLPQQAITDWGADIGFGQVMIHEWSGKKED